MKKNQLYGLNTANKSNNFHGPSVQEVLNVLHGLKDQITNLLHSPGKGIGFDFAGDNIYNKKGSIISETGNDIVIQGATLAEIK